MTDRGSLPDLVVAAAAGDQEAWNAIVDRFTSLLWSVARAHRLSQDDAADVVQNTWLRLLDHLESIQQPLALPGWLATTARREALAVLRRSGRDVLVRGDDLGVGVVDPQAAALDAALLESERDAHLWACFAQLSERCQQLLRVLMSHDRPGYHEVAAAFDMPVGSIGPTRMRCVQRLRVLAGESDYAFEANRGGMS
ncbi:RNA polymerase sigma factor [Lapillicoccus sp.]|uniref:RNA polymerase sigma factor n=1 Tax=Lapillicoccus sp. TaxID=1909287 RepID=UPI0039831B14